MSGRERRALSIEKQVNDWIARAYEQGASDLHVEPEKSDKVRVRARIDGQLRSVETVSGGKQVLARLKIMSDLDVNDRGTPMDGRVDAQTYLQGFPGLDIRVSTLPCMHGEKAVLRLIDNRKLGMGLEFSAMDEEARDCLEQALAFASSSQSPLPDRAL